MNQSPAPSAVLYIATACPHCGAVLEGLTRMIKDGKLARLDVVNIAANPEASMRRGLRSVPWTQIGPFELIGKLSPGEIAEWVEYARSGEGWAAYYRHLLESRRLDEVVRRIHAAPATLSPLLGMLDDDETPMAVRIGISALLEELAGSEPLRAVLPQLEQLTLSGSVQTRADACHFLGLTGERTAIPAVRRLLDDEYPDVREIATETLALLGDTQHPVP